MEDKLFKKISEKLSFKEYVYLGCKEIAKDTILTGILLVYFLNGFLTCFLLLMILGWIK